MYRDIDDFDCELVSMIISDHGAYFTDDLYGDLIKSL